MKDVPKKSPAVATGKRFASVRELLKETGSDPETSERVAKMERESRLVGVLISLRQQANLTQQQMAKKLNVTQSAISKLESSKDEELTLENLRKYSEATGQRLIVNIGKPLNHVEAVKYHAFGIKDQLGALARMARQDGELEQSIQAFFGEAFFNILEILARCQDQMPGNEAEIRVKKLGSPVRGDTRRQSLQIEEIAA